MRIGRVEFRDFASKIILILILEDLNKILTSNHLTQPLSHNFDPLDL